MRLYRDQGQVPDVIPKPGRVCSPSGRNAPLNCPMKFGSSCICDSVRYPRTINPGSAHRFMAGLGLRCVAPGGRTHPTRLSGGPPIHRTKILVITMTDLSSFNPDWVSPPGAGDTIADLLEERNWSQTEFARRTGYTEKHVSLLICGKTSITEDTAIKLERVLGSTAGFWLTREAQYREALMRNTESKVMERYKVAWERSADFEIGRYR